MHKNQFIIAFVLVFCLVSFSSAAEKAYITDSLQITLRTGPSVENKILSLLRSGQSLEIMDTEGDWSHVRVLDGRENSREGWILTRFLISRLPWEMQAQVLMEENSRLKQKLTPLEKNMNEVIQREKELSEKVQARNNELRQLKENFEGLKEGAAEYLKLTEEHKITETKLETAQNQVQELKAENESLTSSHKNKWFATGALVLLCGLMIGLLVGRQQKKRRLGYY
ncbi:TIGR04211 family SH3 domain-containing protein [Thermodesulfobacteriota bacterium]